MGFAIKIMGGEVAPAEQKEKTRGFASPLPGKSDL